ALDEMTKSADRIERELGSRPAYFAYPYGDPGSAATRDFQLAAQAGFKAAVTTRKGLVFAGHRDHLTALPRVSLAGQYQKLRYIDVLLSGAAFALFNGFKRLNVA
ncbi:MAG: polysaccharide deacetylase family protein, partial [Methylocella sp.]